MNRSPYLLPWVRVLLLIRSITSTTWGHEAWPEVKPVLRRALGDLTMVQRYAHLAPAHRREAVEALARGERLQRSGTQSGTSAEDVQSASLVSAR